MTLLYHQDQMCVYKQENLFFHETYTQQLTRFDIHTLNNNFAEKTFFCFY